MGFKHRSSSRHKVLVNTEQEIAHIPLAHTPRKWKRRGVYEPYQTPKIERFIKFRKTLHLRCLAGF